MNSHSVGATAQEQDQHEGQPKEMVTIYDANYLFSFWKDEVADHLFFEKRDAPPASALIGARSHQLQTICSGIWKNIRLTRIHVWRFTARVFGSADGLQRRGFQIWQCLLADLEYIPW